MSEIYFYHITIGWCIPHTLATVKLNVLSDESFSRERGIYGKCENGDNKECE